MNKIYRCITPKLATAKNALFRRDVDGKLKFMERKWDEPRPERESGYMSGGGEIPEAHYSLMLRRPIGEGNIYK